MTLSDLCRKAAAGIPGATVLAGSGLSFTRRGFAARVEFVGQDRIAGGWTEITIRTSSLGTSALQVRTGGLWHDVKNLLGFHDLMVGEAEFDDAFDVSASEPGAALALLAPSVRTILRHVSIYGNFLWRISKAGFLLQIHARPATPNELDSWLVAAFQLLDAIPGAMEAERVRIDPVQTRIDAESTCQICGAPLAQGALARCVKCQTPHHRDCWEFNGRCSTFGCGESRAM